MDRGNPLREQVLATMPGKLLWKTTAAVGLPSRMLTSESA